MTKSILQKLFAASMILAIWHGSTLAQKHQLTQGHGQMQYKSGTDHSMHNMPGSGHGQVPKKAGEMPTEPGQGAFAAIAEIVAMLQKDPDTDWTRVNIEGLQRHLVDMDELALRAKSRTVLYEDKIVFHVTGKGRTLQAIHTMVPAHAGVLAKSTPWRGHVKKTTDGVILTITSAKTDELMKLKALGFIGFMATGGHHQAHHYMMAKGSDHVHAH